MSFALCDYLLTSTAPGISDQSGVFTSGVFQGAFAISKNGYVALPTVSEVETDARNNGISLANWIGGTYTETRVVKNSANETINPNSEGNYSLGLGTYTATYNFSVTYSYDYGPGWGIYIEDLTLTYTFSTFESRLPIKKWTIADVICRCFETAETIRAFGENFPMFILEGVNYHFDSAGIVRRDYSGYAKKLDKILAPEFTFTKMTLREMLQQIGGFIHGEPRVKGQVERIIADASSGTIESKTVKFYEVTFDDYGINEKSKIAEKNIPYITSLSAININDYCTGIDSSVENLTNSLNFAQAVTIEPFAGHYKTLRVTQATIRAEENDNTIIETVRPIREIGNEYQLICNYNGKDYDLTPYVFSITDYNNLSSYEGSYPYAKAYALYYVPGEKNIRGLFFKNPSAVDAVFSKYAISNILSAVIGESVDLNINNLITLCKFQVRYIPFTNGRFLMNKPIVKVGLPRKLAYNQSANAIESRYFGENLKGVVARLGNVEKTITYVLSYLVDVPKIGLKYDDEYTISAVSTEILPTCIKCTLGLTKNFNRQSEHISLNTEKRMWEISERQTVERQTILTDYVVIKKVSNDYTVQKGENVMFAKDIAKELFNQVDDRLPVTAVSVVGYTKGNLKTNQDYIVLPVVSTALGNVIAFNFAFEDNYSAGRNLINVSSGNYFGGFVPYTDYWGRVYEFYLNFSDASHSTTDNPLLYPLNTSHISEGIAIANKVYGGRVLYQKDNREIPSFTYELIPVSDGSVIIGSALASNCKLVNRNPSSFSIVLLANKIDAFANNRYFSAGEDVILITTNIGNYLTFGDDYISTRNVLLNHEAWALITRPTTETIEVVDEEGNTITQTINKGGEILIGQNKKMTAGKIVFELFSNIYKRI